MNFKRAFFTVGGLTLLSRAVGFFRDVLAANYLGAGMAADVFFVALRLPNLFRRLFAEGAFTISFVPLFTGLLKDNEAEARRFANESLAVLLTVLIPFSCLVMLFMPQVMQVITPGYAADATKFALAVELSRYTFPYLLFISVAALLGSMLNALGRFGPYALAPVAFNVVQIIALLVWNNTEIEAARAQAWAVSISGVVQLVWLMISAKRAGWPLRLQLPKLTPMVRRLLRLIGPGALGAGVMQVNIFIDMVLASLLPAGAVSYLSYADRLYQLPVGVIGIAIGTALLPALSRALRQEGHDKALAEQNRALEFGLFLGLPGAVALLIIPVPILTVLYERGAFTSEVTHFTAFALAAYALAIPAYMMSKVLTVAFYAREDTKTPFRISMRTIVVNTLTSIVLMQLFTRTGHAAYAHASLALATALTAWLNIYLLGRALKQRGQFVSDKMLRARVLRLLGSAALTGLYLYGGALVLAPYFHTALWLEAVALFGLLISAGGLYLALAHYSGGQPLGELVQLFTKAPKVAAPEPPVGGD